MLAYLVREHKASQTRKIRKITTKKDKKKDDRSSEECDARRSERLQEEHTYVLKRNIYLLHGRNYTKTRKEIQGRKKTKKTKKKSVLPGTF